jgi:hypothetical protein
MAPKLSVPDDGSDRAGRCGAAWNDTFAVSDVTLNTGGLLHGDPEPMVSKDRAIPICKNYLDISMS